MKWIYIVGGNENACMIMCSVFLLSLRHNISSLLRLHHLRRTNNMFQSPFIFLIATGYYSTSPLRFLL